MISASVTLKLYIYKIINYTNNNNYDNFFIQF